MAKFLVTGGAGFIGSHLTEYLVNRGDEVVVLDDLSDGRLENILGVLGSGRARLVEGSVLDPDTVNACMRDCDSCVHLAAAVGVKRILDDPLETLLTNVRGTDTVLTSAAHHQRKLLFASSSEIYGKNSSPLLREDADRVIGSNGRFRWAYENAKSFGEFLANAYAAEQHADMVTVRLFNTSGPRQRATHGMVIPTFIRQALADQPLTVYGDGTQQRCFTHVADTVKAIATLCDEPGARGHTFDVGAASPIRIRDLAKLVIERVGSSSTMTLVPYEEAYNEGFEELGNREPDTGALQLVTGWSPRFAVTDIIDDLIAFERSLAVAVSPEETHTPN